MRRTLALAVVAALGLVAAWSTAGAAANPQRMVVQLRDLPRGFALDRSKTGVRTNAQVIRDVGPGTAAKVRRFGRLTGYEVTYKAKDFRRGEVPGVLVVIARVSLFRTTAGARGAAADPKSDCVSAGFRRIGLGGHRPVGAGTQVCAMAERRSSTRFLTHYVGWRNGRAIGTVVVVSLHGAVTPLMALTLARRQDARMAAALRAAR